VLQDRRALQGQVELQDLLVKSVLQDLQEDQGLQGSLDSPGLKELMDFLDPLVLLDL